MENSAPKCFLKFAAKERLESLQKGNLYMKNIDFFIKAEEESGVRGQGDKDEAALILNLESFQFIDPKTDTVLVEGKASRTKLLYDDDVKKPILCMAYIDQTDLKLMNETDDYADYTVTLSDKMKDTFGEHVMIISPQDFIKRLKHVFSEKEIDFAHGKAKYQDFEINDLGRMMSHKNQDVDRFFWKDTFFEFQKEYRFILPDVSVDDSYEINIGDISSFSTIVTVDELLSGRVGFRFGFV